MHAERSEALDGARGAEASPYENTSTRYLCDGSGSGSYLRPIHNELSMFISGMKQTVDAKKYLGLNK